MRRVLCRDLRGCKIGCLLGERVLILTGVLNLRFKMFEFSIGKKMSMLPLTCRVTSICFGLIYEVTRHNH